ncbi:MAG: DUF1152 domain-containing protein [Candidatus Hadarchaeales archaeon]
MVPKGMSAALVVGIGGGGDIVSAIPVRNYLKRLGIRVLLGGLTWERYVVDPQPGPRKLSEIQNIEPLSETSALASSATVSTKGIRFTASKVSEFLGEKVLLLDPNLGVRGLIRGISAAIKKFNLDMVVGVDGGGDVLISGEEKNIRSPLLDSMMLATLASLDSATLLAVIGCCTDGELTLEEFMRQLARIARFGGLIGAFGLVKEDAEMMERIVPNTSSEVSRLILAAWRGEFGRFKIRGGTREAEVTPFATITFLIDPIVVFREVNPVAKQLVETESLEEANEVLRKAGLFTELDFERSLKGGDL